MGAIFAFMVVLAASGVAMIVFKKYYRVAQKDGVVISQEYIMAIMYVLFAMIFLAGYFSGKVDLKKDSIELASPGEVFELSTKMGNRVIVGNEDGIIVKYAFQKNTVIDADGMIRIIE